MAGQAIGEKSKVSPAENPFAIVRLGTQLPVGFTFMCQRRSVLSARAVVSLKQQTGIRLPHQRLAHPRRRLWDTAMPRDYPVPCTSE